MAFGEAMVRELRRRGILSQYLYADIQRLKAVADVDEMRRLLAESGIEAQADHTSAVHFADLIEIQRLRQQLKGAYAAAALFAVT